MEPTPDRELLHWYSIRNEPSFNMLALSTPVDKLKGIGPRYRDRLSHLKIETVSDMLFYVPRRYLDFSKIVPISKVRNGEIVTIKGMVRDIVNTKSFKRGTVITEAVIKDSSGSIKAIWFNQAFLVEILKKGTQVMLAGKFERQYGRLGLQSPAYERVSEDPKHVGRIVPIYPETEGVTSRWFRTIIKPLLKLVDEVEDYLPDEVKNRQGLISLPEALKEIHFPGNKDDLERARDRLSFDELFLLQLGRLKSKAVWQKEHAAAIKFNRDTARAFVNSLGFELTKAQKKAAWEILQDLDKETPMNRLLEGDVGSGKTVVAALAMLVAVESGYQSALMCPTEVLAKQHYQKITEMLASFSISTGLLISAVRNNYKERVVEEIRNGNTQIIVGTHALIQDAVEFGNLGLAVVDEQHRFGVRQRQALKENNMSNTMPHFLSMSATPIPRTLTLTLYGDLEISVIDEMPPGRQKIITKLIPTKKRKAAYEFIHKEISRGRQAFVICPLIDESDKLGVKSATQEYQKLTSHIFPDVRIGLLHGKLRPQEKDTVMKEFSQGRIGLLVSTSVVEVGVDVANATIMLIEGAERFGLAQLHQFRGRVGRSGHQSYCFLFTDSRAETSLKRLKALTEISDGFKLAEIDLQLRGPGELFGTLQHGMPDLKMASLLDARLIKRSREEAEKLIEKAPELRGFPLLLRKLSEFELSYHNE